MVQSKRNNQNCQKTLKRIQKSSTNAQAHRTQKKFQLCNLKKNQSQLKIAHIRLAAENDIISKQILRLKNEVSSLREDIYNLLRSRAGEITMRKE